MKITKPFLCHTDGRMEAEPIFLSAFLTRARSRTCNLTRPHSCLFTFLLDRYHIWVCLFLSSPFFLEFAAELHIAFTGLLNIDGITRCSRRGVCVILGGIMEFSFRGLILLHGEILGTECTHQTTRSRLFLSLGKGATWFPRLGRLTEWDWKNVPGTWSYDDYGLCMNGKEKHTGLWARVPT